MILLGNTWRRRRARRERLHHLCFVAWSSEPSELATPTPRFFSDNKVVASSAASPLSDFGERWDTRDIEQRPARAYATERTGSAARGVVPTHPVDPAGRRCRRATQKDPPVRSRVGVPARDGSRKQLTQIGHASAARPPEQVGVLGFELRRSRHTTLPNQLDEAGREAFELSFDERQ